LPTTRREVSKTPAVQSSSSSQIIPIDSHRRRALARRDRLVWDHLSLAEGIARALWRNLPAGCWQVDDLIATANLALTQAATRYRPAAHNGTPFAAYARQRIRGAILDSVRRKNWHEATRPGIEPINGCFGDDHSNECPGEGVLAMERAASLPDHVRQIDSARSLHYIREAISWLPADQRKVVRLYYAAREASLIQIAGELGLSVSKTRELHSQAIQTLRMRLRTCGYFQALRPAA
jgi:RNA polymerase sigma factor for flagellar operon FliA